MTPWPLLKEDPADAEDSPHHADRRG